MDQRTQYLVAAERDEISLREYLDVLRRLKWHIAAFVLVTTAVTLIISLVVPKAYTATVLMSPVTDTPGAGQLGALSSLISQFGGLSSLAGLSMPSDTQRAESVAVLASEALTERYVQANDLLPLLYAKEWDAKTGRWNVSNPKDVPTLWKANQYIEKKIRSITTDSKTGLVRLTITWKNPKLAATWANGLVSLANSYLRNKAIAESQRNIAYLNEQAVKTDLVGAKQAIYAILQNEINKEMLARGNDEYAFKVLDPAVPPEKASFPQKTRWVLIAFFGSLAVALLALFVRIAWLDD